MSHNCQTPSARSKLGVDFPFTQLQQQEQEQQEQQEQEPPPKFSKQMVQWPNQELTLLTKT